MRLNIKVIASSSAGNCTLVWGDDGALLVDCGLPVRYTLESLDKSEVRLSAVGGVLMTHSHGDHIKAPLLKRLLREQVPFFCRSEIRDQLVEKFGLFESGSIKSLGSGRSCAGNFEIESFEVDHDSGGCYGFNVFQKGKKATFATDLGPPGAHLVERFADSDLIVIESNHDTEMLEASPRPYWLKRRIRSAHLSNEGCADFIRKVILASEKPPQAIVLAHLSGKCNDPLLAELAMRKMLGTLGIDTPVIVSAAGRPALPVSV